MLRNPILALYGVQAIIAQQLDRRLDADRIRSVIALLNESRQHSDAKAFAQLFTLDGELRIGNQILATGRKAIEDALQKRRIWSEVTAPLIGNESIRFLSTDLALVNASQSRYGSIVIKESVPVTLIMKLEDGQWRIFSLRIQLINYRKVSGFPSPANLIGRPMLLTYSLL
jgi:uncharacterized protein (TIGR02246 family)